MPEWYLVIAGLLLLSVGALLWTPLWLAQPLLLLAVSALLADTVLATWRAPFPGTFRSGELLRLRALTATLYLLQPLARLYGRLVEGLTPWRWRGPARLALPVPRTRWWWSERWQSEEDRVRALMTSLREAGGIAISGGDYDRWDFEVRGGLLGSSRARVAVEEHGAGRQLVRMRWWPRVSRLGLAFCALCVGLLVAAALSHARAIAVVGLGVLTAIAVGRLLLEAGGACGAMGRTVAEFDRAPATGGEPRAEEGP